MAKINVQPRPGALFELLKKKALTQEEAKKKTHTDRKTLLKINRGEEVKLETLQKVATRLGVPEEYLRQPQAPQAAAVTDNGDDPEPGTILLRWLDAERLKDLFEGVDRIIWHLNAEVRGHEARKFLEDFEPALDDFRKQQELFPPQNHSLRFQLDRLKTADDIAARLEKLAEYRLVLLGAGHLFWECSYKEHSYEDRTWSSEHYSCSSTVHLSIEPLGTQSRREHIYIGTAPPLLSPDLETAVFVNGRQLPSPEEL